VPSEAELGRSGPDRGPARPDIESEPARAEAAGYTGHDRPLAPRHRPPPLGRQVHARQHWLTDDPEEHPGTCPTASPREPRMGIPKDPRRTSRLGHQRRSIDRLGDPQGQRHRPGPAAHRASLVTIPALSGRGDPGPRSSSPLPGPWVTRHQRGFTHVRTSGLPLACAPGWNGTRFGFFPELHTPQLPATHVRAGTGPEHWPEAMSPTSSVLHPASSLAACDLVSHVLGPVIPDEQPHVLSRPRCSIWPAACGRTISALMKQCSRPEPGRRARHPSSDQLSRPAGRGTVCQQGFKAQESKVLTCRRLPGTESARWGPGRTH
jgi:hypothetical protein